jgi:hypothetical protein
MVAPVLGIAHEIKARRLAIAARASAFERARILGIPTWIAEAPPEPAKPGAPEKPAIAFERPSVGKNGVRRYSVLGLNPKKSEGGLRFAHAVVDAAAAEFGVAALDILSPLRPRKISHARRATIRTLRDCGWSLSSIGRALDLDHSSICHACQKSESMPPEWKAAVDRIKARVAPCLAAQPETQS